MTAKTYHLPDGSFSTDEVQQPVQYSDMWVITAEQAEAIEAGADIRIVNGELVVVPYVDASTYVEELTPPDGQPPAEPE